MHTSWVWSQKLCEAWQFPGVVGRAFSFSNAASNSPWVRADTMWRMSPIPSAGSCSPALVERSMPGFLGFISTAHDFALRHQLAEELQALWHQLAR